jgi:predicted amidophosphoribosyltransferase
MTTRPVNLRFPIDLYNDLQDYAKANKKTISDVIFTACAEFLDTNTPGLCPKCHTQNDLDADYCKKCRQPLSDKAIYDMQKTEELIQSSPECMAIFQEFLHKMEQRNRDKT